MDAPVGKGGGQLAREKGCCEKKQGLVGGGDKKKKKKKKKQLKVGKISKPEKLNTLG